ncbi:hypothetical protein BT69DRAFT_1282895 [Atractiella rhizophila]|nr:hypothetical protein BT69DRAFT_1282895 [Atractiella rhizophila]
MFLALGKAQDLRKVLLLWIGFLLLICGVAFVDIVSRHHASRHPCSLREAAETLVPWLLFWGFHLIIAFGYTMEHLEGKKWGKSKGERKALFGTSDVPTAGRKRS